MDGWIRGKPDGWMLLMEEEERAAEQQQVMMMHAIMKSNDRKTTELERGT